jgi:hypothetical protein
VKTFAQNGALLRNFLAAARKELRPVGTNHTNSAHPEKCLFMNRMREKISRLPRKNAENKNATRRSSVCGAIPGARVFVR